MEQLLATPRAGSSHSAKSCSSRGQVVGDVFGLRVFSFFGETLRQAGILIVGSTLDHLGADVHPRPAVRDRGRLLHRRAGRAGLRRRVHRVVRPARDHALRLRLHDVREGRHGIVAELGAMRISDEIDALEVMGINSMTFLCATRLLAAWLVLPFMYLAAIGAGFLACYIAVVQQIGYVSSGGYFLIFWQFQNPPDFLFSLIKAMAWRRSIVLVGCLLRLQRQRGPGRGRDSDRQVDGVEHRRSCTSSACSAPSSSGARIPARRSEAERGRARTRPGRTATPSGAGDPTSPIEHHAAPASQAASRTAHPSRVPARRRPAGPGGASFERARPRTPAPNARAPTRSSTPAHLRPSGRPTRSSSSTCTSHSAATTSCAASTWACPRDKISMILGPSGTGKSVCIKHIVGLLYPDEGDVLGARRVGPEHRRRRSVRDAQEVRVLFQDGALFGSMNLYDNVAFPLRQHTEKGEEEIADIVTAA